MGISKRPTAPLRINSKQSGIKSNSPSKVDNDPVASPSPPSKVIIDVGDLRKVNLSRLLDPSTREFVVVALFDNDDINEAMEKKRQRTKVIEGKFSLNVYSANFASHKIILPVKEGANFVRLYVSAISTDVQTDNEKTTKEVSLKGLGYTEGIPLKCCKTYPWKTYNLITAVGGDETTATLEVHVRCCKSNYGPEIPPDEEENIMKNYE